MNQIIRVLRASLAKLNDEKLIVEGRGGAFCKRDKSKLSITIGVFMVSGKLLELLNKGIAHELQTSIQYMWQRITVKGIKAPQ